MCAPLVQPTSSRASRSGVSCVTMNEELQPSSLETAPPEAVTSGTSAKEASDLLVQRLIEVVRWRFVLVRRKTASSTKIPTVPVKRGAYRMHDHSAPLIYFCIASASD